MARVTAAPMPIEGIKSMPPIRGTAFLCTLRPFGWSRIPRSLHSFTMKGVPIRENTRLMENAINKYIQCIDIILRIMRQAESCSTNNPCSSLLINVKVCYLLWRFSLFYVCAVILFLKNVILQFFSFFMLCKCSNCLFALSVYKALPWLSLFVLRHCVYAFANNVKIGLPHSYIGGVGHSP